jgi:hypothetical protein
MTRAAEQCREYTEDKYPGVRIGRQACRDTVGGSISQHSAYTAGQYDSNALDIMGGSTPGSNVKWTRAENIVLIQTIVDDLTTNLTAWSIRKILWKVPDHYGHAHIDFYPMCDTRQWCAGTQPEAVWIYSDGRHIRSDDPPPENGDYDGDDMSFIDFRTEEFDMWSDANVVAAYDRDRFESGDRNGFISYWCFEYFVDRGGNYQAPKDSGNQTGGRVNRTPAEKARFMTDFYSSGTP